MDRYATVTEMMRDTWLVQLVQKIFQQQEMKTHIDACTARCYTTSHQTVLIGGNQIWNTTKRNDTTDLDVGEEEEFNISKGQEETKQEEN